MIVINPTKTFICPILHFTLCKTRPDNPNITGIKTAEAAIEASNTGHLVFSTLHTNSAAGVIPRLIDLGVNPKILVSALKLSLAQRLCRTLCVACKKEVPLDADKEKLIRDINQKRIVSIKTQLTFLRI
jgi:type II secretory ATPase GspE/PulE/Tfp pilus assembly ATPase PilB-like protein